MIKLQVNGVAYAVEIERVPPAGLCRRFSLLEVCRHVGVAIPHQRTGTLRCTDSHVVVQDSMNNLTPMEEDEADLLAFVETATLHSRLACRAVVLGDVSIRIG